MGKDMNMTAFTTDLLTAIAKETKFNFQIIPGSTENLLNDLDDGDYDAVLSVLSPTPYNQEKYSFSNPFYLTGPVVIVPKSSPVHSLSDLQGLDVAIRAGSSTAYTLQKIPSVSLITYDNINVALDDLDRGKIDAVIMDSIPAYSLIQWLYSGKEKIVTAPLTNSGLRLIAKHDSSSEELIKRFNEGLEIVKKNGTYHSLLNKWDLINTNPF